MAPFDESAAPAAAAALAAVRAHDLHELGAAARAAVVTGGVTFSSDGDPDFHLDPVPRVIPAEDWAPLEAGLAQRVRAVDRFAADAYGERAIVAARVVPARVLDSCEYLEPGVQGVWPAGDCWVGVAG